MKPEEARQALDTLLGDARGDMAEAEIDELISRELDKGEAMDADLVSEALREGEMGAHKGENWAAIEKRLNGTVLPKRRMWSRMTAAAAIIIALISVGAAGTYAARWDFLVQVFRPMMETLGIHINVEDLGSAGDVERDEGRDPEAEYTSVTIKDERSLPRTVRSIKAVPSWIPEGYVFKYAELFDGFNESSLLISYSNGKNELFVQTIVYGENTARTAVNLVEKEAEDGAENAPRITITENEGIVNATKESGLACFMVWGRLSQSDILSVITSIG